MPEQTGNVQPQLDLSEHDASGGVDTKKVFAYGWDANSLVKRPFKVDANGVVQITIA